MADDIIQFAPGGKVTAEETNENNLLLKEWALDNSASEAYIDSKITTLTNNLNTQISSINTQIATKANTGANNFTDNGKMYLTYFGMPKVSARTNRTVNTEYTAGSNGWLYVEHGTSSGASFYVLLNDTRMGHCAGTSATTMLVPVWKNARYKVTGTDITYYWFMPTLGG